MRSALAAILLRVSLFEHLLSPKVPVPQTLVSIVPIQARNPVSTGATPDLIHVWCGVHVIQYQKNEGPIDSGGGTKDYRLTVTLKDALQDVIGGGTLLSVPGAEYVGIDSQLPYVFEVEVGGLDSEPVFFKYASQSWNSNDGQCSVGGYAKGYRQMDCGFNCWMLLVGESGKPLGEDL